MRNSGAEQEMQVLYVIGKILIGALIAFGVCVLCLLVFSLGVSNGLLPEKWIASLTIAACLIGSGAGGRFACEHQKGRCLLIGAAVGGALFLMLLTIGYFVYRPVELGSNGGFLLSGCLCGGVLAGLLGGSRTEKKNVKARKKKKRK